MIRLIAKGICVLVIVCSYSIESALAAPTVSVKGRRTDVALSSELLNALETLGVGVQPIKNARIRRGQAKFPIPAGELDLETAAGEIWHTGGLSLSAGETVVDLSLFIIDTTTPGAAVLTGIVKANDTLIGRLPLFDIELPSLKLPLAAKSRITIPNANLTLTEEAAAALNSVFNVEAFVEGFPIGTAHVVLRALTR